VPDENYQPEVPGDRALHLEESSEQHELLSGTRIVDSHSSCFDTSGDVALYLRVEVLRYLHVQGLVEINMAFSSILRWYGKEVLAV